MREKRKYAPVDPTLATSLPSVRLGEADAAAAAAVRANPRAPQRSAVAAWLASLGSPVSPTPAEARACLALKGWTRVELDPTDPNVIRAVAPAKRLTLSDISDAIQSATGSAPPAPSVRRLAQEMRDRGLLEFVGRGEYRVPSGGVNWPETKRGEGWVVTKGGKLYVL